MTSQRKPVVIFLAIHFSRTLRICKLTGKDGFSEAWQTQVEVKPYVLDDQMCDECQGTRCGGKFAPFFCANVTCLQYYCEYCWASIHSRAGREFHKPLVKEGGDRPRHVPFRWS
ncbi:Cytoplasmic polyadenylation element-binding protein 3 [Microtus ochrogaster]|uniref:Cytoplasmic polyadenylation element-binding protein 3 n=1 Tax=Microtus ochrogaster TaxID=79684 RepID=A0A8J6L011_MICOH|nr:Cytoplasmic polyadenylation element-binding protein 3 [Microtus ochrogaster]